MIEKRDDKIVEFLDNEMNNGATWPDALANTAEHFDIANEQYIVDLFEEELS